MTHRADDPLELQHMMNTHRAHAPPPRLSIEAEVELEDPDMEDYADPSHDPFEFIKAVQGGEAVHEFICSYSIVANSSPPIQSH